MADRFSFDYFEATALALGLNAERETFQTLHALYSGEDRHYHDVLHIEECLGHLERAGAEREDKPVLALALLFHDAIYDTHGSDNELKSAELARKHLSEAGASDALLADVERLILATRHQAAPKRDDEKLLVDIDLAILGAPEARFEKYDADVRREYHWIPKFAFEESRARILQSFLDRPYIYSTEAFRKEFEERARRNLKAKIKQLSP